MISFKALLIGVASMIFLGLIFELVFLFIDVGYNSLMKSYPDIIIFRQGFYYLIVAAGLFGVMFTGGFLTSIYAKKYSRLHSIVVAAITCGIALYATTSSYELTLLSVLFIVVSIGFALLGNIAWQKNNVNNPR